MTASKSTNNTLRMVRRGVGGLKTLDYLHTLGFNVIWSLKILLWQRRKQPAAESAKNSGIRNFAN